MCLYYALSLSFIDEIFNLFKSAGQNNYTTFTDIIAYSVQRFGNNSNIILDYQLDGNTVSKSV